MIERGSGFKIKEMISIIALFSWFRDLFRLLILEKFLGFSQGYKARRHAVPVLVRVRSNMLVAVPVRRWSVFSSSFLSSICLMESRAIALAFSILTAVGVMLRSGGSSGESGRM